MNTRPSASLGFSLPELLSVLALLSVLTGIFAPVFVSARDRARQVTCASNEKQILRAVLMYAQDSDSMLPRLETNPGGKPHYDHDAEDDQWIGIENALEPSLHAGLPWGPARDNTVWHCPEDTIPRDDCAGRPGVATGYTISYGFSYYAVPPAQNADPYKTFGVFAADDGVDSRRLGQIGLPADTVIMYEFFCTQSYARRTAGFRYNNADVARSSFVTWPQTLQIPSGCKGAHDTWSFSIGAHDGRTNFGFADGHVQSLPHTALMRVQLDTHLWDGGPNMMHWDAAYHRK